MVVLVRKTVGTVFMIGLFILAILSVIGMIYLTQMAFSNKKQTDGKW